MENNTKQDVRKMFTAQEEKVIQNALRLLTEKCMIGWYENGGIHRAEIQFDLDETKELHINDCIALEHFTVNDSWGLMDGTALVDVAARGLANVTMVKKAEGIEEEE